VPFLRQLYINESELILSLNRTTGSYKLLYSVEGTKQGAPESSHVFNMVSLNALNALINELIARLQDIAAGLVESIAGGDAQQPVLAGDGPDLGLLGGILLVLDNSKQVADEQSPHEHSR